jgi:hypothetical protein
MVVITSVVPAGGFQVTNTPTGLLNASILDTGVTTSGGPILARGGHGLRNGLIITGIALGTGLGVGLAVGTQGNKTSKCPPGSASCG